MFTASVEKLVNSGDLKSPVERLAGSSPARGTKIYTKGNHAKTY
jgi:hypothetical protein